MTIWEDGKSLIQVETELEPVFIQLLRQIEQEAARYFRRTGYLPPHWDRQVGEIRRRQLVLGVPPTVFEQALDNLWRRIEESAGEIINRQEAARPQPAGWGDDYAGPVGWLMMDMLQASTLSLPLEEFAERFRLGLARHGVKPRDVNGRLSRILNHLRMNHSFKTLEEVYEYVAHTVYRIMQMGGGQKFDRLLVSLCDMNNMAAWREKRQANLVN